MNPFEQTPIKIEDAIMDWTTIYSTPYNKQTIDPYSKLRILLMNCIELESIAFKHQFHRHCNNNELRREITLLCCIEQQQQKQIHYLKPIEETYLETTIDYEFLSVELAAILAQSETNTYFNQLLDFTLIEDFDHLYRFANLLSLDSQIPTQSLVNSLIDISPGRPSIAQHRFPFDSIKTNIHFQTADIRTKLNAWLLTAVEQQILNFYSNIGNAYHNDLGRQLYLEIAMLEEQHVTQYESLLDANVSWLENLLLQEYLECYLYYSFSLHETDGNLKQIWDLHLQHEISHLHKAADLLQKYENKNWKIVIPSGKFLQPLQFYNTKDYIRSILAEQIKLTSNRETFTPIINLPPNHPFFFYQSRVNHDINTVASHNVIIQHQLKYNIDYRAETMPNPVAELSDRTTDNTQIARTPIIIS